MAKMINYPFLRQIKNIAIQNPANFLCRRTVSSSTAESVSENEMRHFEQLATNWWNRNGPMKALHSLNSIRVPFIRDGLISTGATDQNRINSASSLHGVKLLEVGCGAGILTEQLARTHAHLTAIDPCKAVIDIAIEHTSQDELLSQRINYLNESVEEHSTHNQCKYDAVIVSEVLEHVLEKDKFLKYCVSTLKPGGSIFITTFDKTCFSYIGAIIIAEMLIKLVPSGTHNWDHFISPLDTQRILEDNGCSTILVNGFMYEVCRDKWHWIPTTKLSYALQAIKVH